MLELIWKGGAEQDLLTIFADLEDYGDGAGERFTLVLDSVRQNLRAYPEMAPACCGFHGLWRVLHRRGARNNRPRDPVPSSESRIHPRQNPPSASAAVAEVPGEVTNFRQFLAPCRIL